MPTSARHTATLNWTAVHRKTDGKRLSNLAGYKVYYGTSPDTMSAIVLANPDVTTYRFTQLSPGVWYFAVAAYTTDGVEGLQSNVVSKTVR
jgi:hypothetical protein